MTIRDRVQLLLQARGPMTTRAIEDEIAGASAAIRDARYKTPGAVFRIAGYERQEGQRRLPMYEAAGGVDEPPPRIEHAEARDLPKGRRPVNRERIVQLLLARGPMTASAIGTALQRADSAVNDTLRDARRCHPGKIFRIVGYTETPNGQKGAAIYAAQAGEDVPYVRAGLREKAAPVQDARLATGFWAGLGGRGQAC